MIKYDWLTEQEEELKKCEWASSVYVDERELPGYERKEEYVDESQIVTEFPYPKGE